MNYYATLGIDRSATEHDVKRAYRKLALKYHPEKNTDTDPDEARVYFRDIAEAYEVLSNAERRALFDQFGEEGLKYGVPDENGGTRGGNYFFSGDPNDVFFKFFGTQSPFSIFEDVGAGQFFNEFGGLTRHPRTKKLPAAKREVYCSLEELYIGGTKNVKISKREMNPDGQTTRQVEKYLTLDILPGYRKGTIVEYPNEGDQGPNVYPADLMLVLNEQPHDRFKREGNDLIYTAKVHLLNALTGFSLRVQTLDDRTITIPVDEVVDHSSTKVLKGEGMPISEDPTQHGDLIIKFDITFPKYFEDWQKDLLNKAFGASE